MSDENTTQTGNKEMGTEDIVECLRHLGIEDEKCIQAGKYKKVGQNEELLGFLRKCRCTLMDEMHESQRKVDCLDLMIHRLEKNS